MNELGVLLGFKNRSKLVRYLFKYFYDEYQYIMNPKASLYVFIKFDMRSEASAYIMNLHARYMNDFEVLSLKNNDYVTTMVLCYTGDVNRLNGLVNKIMRLKGVKKMRFIGF